MYKFNVILERLNFNGYILTILVLLIRYSKLKVYLFNRAYTHKEAFTQRI